MLDIVIKAKQMGIFTIVCDYSPTSPAKQIADRSYDISTADIETLVKIGDEEKIDGVLTAFEDLNTWNALKICQILKLPFYATEKQLKITSDKFLFKEFCRQYGVPVVPYYRIDSAGDLDKIDDMSYPVIIKPTDNYGSKGITICNNPDELKDGYLKALSFSRQGRVVLEPFIGGYGVEMYYTVINGEPFLSAMADRYVFQQKGGYPPLPTATIFPSKHLGTFCEKYNDKVKYLINGLEIMNGLLLFQAAIDNGSFRIYEMAFRLTGEKHYQIILKETGLDLLEMMIELSLYGIVDKKYVIKYFDRECLPLPACNLAILLKKGRIKSIKGLDKIKEIPEVISCVQTLKEGDEVSRIGDYGQMCLRINFYAKDHTRLLEIIDNINKNLNIISDDDSDMILTRFMEKEIF